MLYKEFIQNIIDTRGQWNIPEGEYFEAHHIIPKCLGGTGEIRKGRKFQHHENIIFLYAREHFTAHKLLAEENPDNSSLVYAWCMMAFPKGKTKRNFEILPEEYEELRVLCSKHMSLNNPALSEDGHPWNYGLTKETDERIKKYADEAIGRNTWSKGLKRTEEQKIKQSNAAKKRHLEHPETFVCGTKDKLSINNGEICYYIDKNEFLPDGFSYGQGKREHYTIKDPEANSKLRHEQCAGEKNPMFGHGERISGSKNGHAIYIYTYDGIDYQTRDDLIVRLKLDFPNISESAIRKIQTGDYGKRIINKYQEIITKLTWRLKKDENKIN